ncbi:MAG: hypothetical protein ACK2TU_05990 [Anaerolineales bacterium]
MKKIFKSLLVERLHTGNHEIDAKSSNCPRWLGWIGDEAPHDFLQKRLLSSSIILCTRANYFVEPE